MIVRISGVGQYELDDDAVRRLDQLDTALTEALDAGNEEEFRRQLSATIELIQQSGRSVSGDRVVPSEVIVPPDDISLDEARGFFTDEGLMQPLPA